MTGSLTIRPASADDDLEAELDLRHRAFGPISRADREDRLTKLRASVSDGSLIGAWDGAVLVASARLHDMRQWWGGLALPMAGVGGVKVAPEARGRGVGKALMSEVLRVMAGRGYLLSALYPATAHMYRSLGWEFAGGFYRAEIPGRSLGALIPPDPQNPGAPPWDGTAPDTTAVEPPSLRRATEDDADEVIAVLGAVHARGRDCGPCTWDPQSIRRWLADPDLFGYLAPDGFLGYGWWNRGSRDIVVYTLQAASARTARTLWGIVASHMSVTKVVHANVSPNDPIAWLTREPDVSVRMAYTWMLRVLDPQAAVTGRGFPAGVQVSVPLVLADPDLPANAGRFALTVNDGRGRLAPGGPEPATGSPAAEPVSLGPRGFAALFGGVPLPTMRKAGLIVGGSEQTDALLGSAFTCRAFLLDTF